MEVRPASLTCQREELSKKCQPVTAKWRQEAQKLRLTLGVKNGSKEYLFFFRNPKTVIAPHMLYLRRHNRQFDLNDKDTIYSVTKHWGNSLIFWDMSGGETDTISLYIRELNG